VMVQSDRSGYGNLLSSPNRKDRTIMGKSLIAGLAATVVLIVVCVEGGKHFIGTEKGHAPDVLLEAKSSPHDLHFSNVSGVIFAPEPNYRRSPHIAMFFLVCDAD
jgi:hypothetical protein